MERCSGDQSCAEGEKCCSNGCGHACMKVAVATPQAPTTTEASPDLTETMPATKTDPRCGICPLVLCKLPEAVDIELCKMTPARKDECGCSGCATWECPEPSISCQSDADCAESHFCEVCRGGSKPATCKPRLGLGGVCGGFVMCVGQCQSEFACYQQYQPNFGPQVSTQTLRAIFLSRTQ